MYERFTDAARKVMQRANQEALRFEHEYIGTEHILLGLVREGAGVAANVLKNRDIDPRKVSLEVEKIVQSEPRGITTGKLPQTPKGYRTKPLASCLRKITHAASWTQPRYRLVARSSRRASRPN
jgi:ATP-dependent Clp protease ATP-binding subunit ClpA